MGRIYLTQAGYDKLCKELEHLKRVKRRELSRAVGEARAHGDISENAEYDAAKEAQGLNELRIVELEEKLANAQIINNEDMSTDEILIGATVQLKDLGREEIIEYTLVSEVEANFEERKISITSPVGSALVGHRVHDVVAIQVPAGILKYEVLKISR